VVVRVIVTILAVLVLAAPATAAERVRASGAEPVSWDEDGCWIHVHRAGYRLPQAELHVQCTTNTGGYLGSGALIRYRYPERGTPTSFGALIEEDGHGWEGDLPYLRAWQDPERPRIGYVWVPGPHEYRPNGTYVHVVWVVWNGALHDAVREVHPPPLDKDVA
jgi:hypothetical protein